MNPRTFALIPALLAGFHAQREFNFVDAAKNMTVRAEGGRIDQGKLNSSVIVLKGNVSIKSASQGLTLTADTVQCETEADKQGRSEIRHATGTGNVHLVKIVTDKGAQQTTDIRGSSGVLDVQPTGDVVKLTGPVRIESINAQPKQTMLATGSSGTVTLEHAKSTKFGNGLRTGTLQGPVRVTLDHAPAKDGGQPTHVIATGDRMDFENDGPQPLIRMTGHVEIHGQAMGDITGLSTATLHLNQSRQIETWEAGS